MVIGIIPKTKLVIEFYTDFCSESLFSSLRLCLERKLGNMEIDLVNSWETEYRFQALQGKALTVFSCMGMLICISRIIELCV